MTQNKDVKQGRTLRSFPPLAAANLLFFCLEFILAIETRSASLFADNIAFLEGASVSVLLSSGRNWSMPGREAFARFSRTILLIPICFLFWMITANYHGAAIPSATPLAATGAALLLTNIACLVMLKHGMFAHLAGSLSDVHNHAIMQAVVVLLFDLGIRNDVAGCARRPRNSLRECQCGRAHMACCEGAAVDRCMS
jgi:Co/Zn/Cd efflux system component